MATSSGPNGKSWVQDAVEIINEQASRAREENNDILERIANGPPIYHDPILTSDTSIS